jgi:LysM repeat protein
LSAADRRIVLLENGTWIMVGEDGEIILPSKSVDEDEVRVVYGNGTWRDVPVSQMRIPENRYDPETEDTPAETAKYHTVKSGDTLSGLAVKYNTKVSEICRLSGIKASQTLKIGMKLRVK